ncbi:MAG: AI-2E family transporter, partial [Caldilineaceae bacterium]|nr:AI-2E family transporter [Caldilineaceae bacterium]
MVSGRWSNLTKIIVVAVVVLLAIILLITLRAMIVPTIIAFLLAFILSYPVNWIQRRTGWPRGITVGLIYIMLLAAAIIGPALLYPRGNELIVSLQQTLQEIVINLQTVTAGPIVTIGNYTLSLDSLLNNVG